MSEEEAFLKQLAAVLKQVDYLALERAKQTFQAPVFPPPRARLTLGELARVVEILEQVFVYLSRYLPQTPELRHCLNDYLDAVAELESPLTRAASTRMTVDDMREAVKRDTTISEYEKQHLLDFLQVLQREEPPAPEAQDELDTEGIWSDLLSMALIDFWWSEEDTASEIFAEIYRLSSHVPPGAEDSTTPGRPPDPLYEAARRDLAAGRPKRAVMREYLPRVARAKEISERQAREGLKKALTRSLREGKKGK